MLGRSQVWQWFCVTDPETGVLMSICLLHLPHSPSTLPLNPRISGLGERTPGWGQKGSLLCAGRPLGWVPLNFSCTCFKILALSELLICDTDILGYINVLIGRQCPCHIITEHGFPPGTSGKQE